MVISRHPFTHQRFAYLVVSSIYAADITVSTTNSVAFEKTALLDGTICAPLLLLLRSGVGSIPAEFHRRSLLLRLLLPLTTYHLPSQPIADFKI